MEVKNPNENLTSEELSLKIEATQNEWQKSPQPMTKFLGTLTYLTQLYQWLLGLRRNPETRLIISGPKWFCQNSEAIKGMDQNLKELLSAPEKHYYFMKTTVFEKYLLQYYELHEEPVPKRYKLIEEKREEMLKLLAWYYSFKLEDVPPPDQQKICNYVYVIINALFLPQPE